MNRIIEVKNLCKSFGKVRAVDDLSMEVRQQEIFAFLGPNGAGKSTTIDILCTYLRPDAGEVVIDGYRLGQQDDEIRKIIGVIHQKSLLDKYLSVYDNLLIRGGVSGLEKQQIKETIERVSAITGIQDFLKRPYGELSGGQRRRVDIARGLLVAPKILFLDEPTTGLDPQSRLTIWEFIRQLQQETGITVFLTTHYLEEAAKADYVVVIDHGQVAAQGTPQQLREEYASHRLIIDTSEAEQVRSLLQDSGFSCHVGKDLVTVMLKDTKQSIEILQRLEAQISSFEVIKGTLDDAFIAITGKEIRE